MNIVFCMDDNYVSFLQPLFVRVIIHVPSIDFLFDIMQNNILFEAA